MRVHWLQHVPFEGLGTITSWAEQNNHIFTSTRFWAVETLPEPADIQMLVVMGGPMGVYDEDEYSWLRGEKHFIRAVADNGAGILGVCLGAQLLAEVFGAEVYKNKEQEIGWYPVSRSAKVPDWLVDVFPGELNVLHWHGDTFDIPAGGTGFCSSAACVNQGFVIGDRLIGLQFHLELRLEDLAVMIDNCRVELVPGPWIQNEGGIISHSTGFMERKKILAGILDYLQTKSDNRSGF